MKACRRCRRSTAFAEGSNDHRAHDSLAPRWKTTRRSIRPGEQLEWDRLESYLRERLASHIPAADLHQPMEASQFPGGHSNLTYLVRFGGVGAGGATAAARPGAAQGARHGARIPLARRASTRCFPLAPRPYLFCEDASVIGAIFYVMERRRGLVVRDCGAA